MDPDEPGTAPAEPSGSESGVHTDAQLRAILDSSLDALITIDENGRIVEFNRAAERIVPSSLREAHREGLIGRDARHFRAHDLARSAVRASSVA